MSNVPSDNDSRPKKINTTVLILSIGFLVVVAALVIALVVLLNRPTNFVGDSNAIGTGAMIIDESNLESAMEDLAETVDEGMFTTEMNVAWTFPNSTDPSEDIYFANAGSNNSNIYFELIMPDDEIVYTSSLIPPGSRVKQVALQKEVAPATYTAICKIYLVNDSNEVKSDVSLEVQVTVLE